MDSIENFSQLSGVISISLCLVLSIIYVSSLYVWNSQHDRWVLNYKYEIKLIIHFFFISYLSQWPSLNNKETFFQRFHCYVNSTTVCLFYCIAWSIKPFNAMEAYRNKAGRNNTSFYYSTCFNSCFVFWSNFCTHL